MRSTRSHATRVRRGRTAGVAVAVALGLVACSDPVADPSALTREDVDGIRGELDALGDRLATVEDRLSALEEGPDRDPGDRVDEPGSPDGEDTFFGAPRSFLGEEISVRGEVAELLASSDVASALRIAGEVGEPVAVVTVTPPPEVATGDVVEVAGTAVEVDPDTFEADFGIAADELFADPRAWLADADGQVAIAAIAIELVGPTGD
jgi:hypothetical protein